MWIIRLCAVLALLRLNERALAPEKEALLSYRVRAGAFYAAVLVLTERLSLYLTGWMGLAPEEGRVTLPHLAVCLMALCVLRRTPLRLTKADKWRTWRAWIGDWGLLLLLEITLWLYSPLFPETDAFGRLMLLALVPAVLCYRKRFPRLGGKVWWSVCRMLLTSVVFWYLGVLIYSPQEEIVPLYGALTVAFLFLGQLVLYLFSGRCRFAIVGGGTIYFVWTLAHYFVLAFRGTPLIPVDILNAGTAAEVAGAYHFLPTRGMWIYLTVLLLLCCLLRGREEPPVKGTLPVRLGLGAALAALLFLVLPNTTLLVEGFSLKVTAWQQTEDYRKLGHTLAFYVTMVRSRVTKPEGYSEERLAALAEEYPSGEAASQTRPNIIVVMNEALADLGDVGPLTVNRDYMPFIHSLEGREDYFVGRTLMPVFGGGTCNSEWEFLTGCSMEFAPGITPYSQESFQGRYSLCSYLKNLGYRTVATHPQKASNWRRNTVYPDMGFDETLFEEAYEGGELLRGWCMSDADVYRKLLTLAEEGEGPRFIFAVTMQNHGGYDGGAIREGEAFPVREEVLSSQPLDQYLSLAYESDRAFEGFMAAVDELEEPTVVVLFGDHFPSMETEVFNALRGGTAGTLAETQRMYATPCIVHANYEIDYGAFEPFMSVNYLGASLLRGVGLPTAPFYEFQLAMREAVPAINPLGYLDAGGVWHEPGEETEEKEQWIRLYHELQYNARYGEAVKELFEPG